MWVTIIAFTVLIWTVIKVNKMAVEYKKDPQGFFIKHLKRDLKLWHKIDATIIKNGDDSVIVKRMGFSDVFIYNITKQYCISYDQKRMVVKSKSRPLSVSKALKKIYTEV